MPCSDDTPLDFEKIQVIGLNQNLSESLVFCILVLLLVQLQCGKLAAEIYFSKM